MRQIGPGFMSAALILFLLIGVAGCGSSSVETAAKPTEKSATPTAASELEAKVTVPMSLGDMSLFIYLPPLLADTMGYFAEEGLVVEPKTYKGGSAIAQALAAREVKFASMGLDNAVRYRGVDMVAVMAYTHTPGMVFMVHPDYADSIKSYKDLIGKKVGITSPGSGSHTVFSSMLLAHDISPESVEFVPVGFSLDKAFQEKKIVAGYAYDPLATRMLDKGEGILLSDLRTIEETKKYLKGPFSTSVLATTRHVIEQEPELVKKVVRAMMKAHQYILTQPPEQIAKVVPSKFKVSDDATWIAGFRNSKVMFDSTGMMSKELVENSVYWMRETKALMESDIVSIEALYDTSFAGK